MPLSISSLPSPTLVKGMIALKLLIAVPLFSDVLPASSGTGSAPASIETDSHTEIMNGAPAMPAKASESTWRDESECYRSVGTATRSFPDAYDLDDYTAAIEAARRDACQDLYNQLQADGSDGLSLDDVLTGAAIHGRPIALGDGTVRVEVAFELSETPRVWTNDEIIQSSDGPPTPESLSTSKATSFTTDLSMASSSAAIDFDSLTEINESETEPWKRDTNRMPLVPSPTTIQAQPETFSRPLDVPSPTADITGIVVDARGTGAVPGLTPRILSSDETVLFDASSMPLDKAYAFEPVHYATSLNEALDAKRTGEAPMVIQALPGRPESLDIVLPEELFANPGDSEELLKYLRAGRVVVVLDPLK